MRRWGKGLSTKWRGIGEVLRRWEGMKKLIRQPACMRLPKFKTEEEETHFWNTHSPLDYPGEFMDVKEPFEFAPTAN